MATLSLQKVSFGYESGTDLFKNLSVSFDPNRHIAIVGDNGCGKTTLLNILAGKISPDHGTRTTNASIYLMPQRQYPNSQSGGEHQMNALRRAFDSGADILLLDEPTNNLDADARAQFFAWLRAYSGGVVVVSHDRELLRNMDIIMELSNGGITTYGGNYDFYCEQKNISRGALASRYTDAEKEISRLQKTLTSATRTRITHESKQSKDKSNTRRSRIAANALSGKSQETEAKKRAIIQAKINTQSDILTNLGLQMRDDTIKIPLPAGTYHDREILNIQDMSFSYGDKQIFSSFNLSVRTGNRVLITGRNGAGKSTLLKLITGQLSPTAGTIKCRGNIAYLDQTLSTLSPDDTIVDAIMNISGATKHDAHAIAANFGFRGAASLQKTGTLSGGELLKATLAAILGTPIQPDLFILDEPTNNLEIKSIQILEDALNQYRGAILLVSHDMTFVQNIHPTAIINI